VVKIVNPLGDVKIGKQGEVVYQRKYGEQIRRQVSPKRAMSSQAQIAHRQLYRDALAWRSHLSLANRRYLDGYCLANGIVDSYHIPLVWSRFALKLYLEAVKFVIITKPTSQETENEGKTEYYDDTGLGTYEKKVYTTFWACQTFTPQLDFELTSIEIFAKRTYFPHDVENYIYETLDGKPTGSPIASKTMMGSDFTYNVYAWTTIPLTYPCLEKGKMYAYVIAAPDAGTSRYIRWWRDNTAALYPRGTVVDSYDSGVNWTIYASDDYIFRVHGKWTVQTGEPGILHVRHPALSTVVHKRGGIIINAYDTLSSLDGEYLTGQVGLDVERGDIIEATTLPGIEFDYRVG